MNVTGDDWCGLLDLRSDPEGVVDIEQVLKLSKQGITGAFCARGSDGHTWWIKSKRKVDEKEVFSGHGNKVAVTEYVVGSVGSLIDAPTCKVAVVRVPEDIVARIPEAIIHELHGDEPVPGPVPPFACRAGFLSSGCLISREGLAP